MIRFKKYYSLIETFNCAWQHFNCKVNGDPFDIEKLQIGIDKDYCGKFGDEFEEILYNHPRDNSYLSDYIEKVYYPVVYLLLKFDALHWEYFRKFGVTPELDEILDQHYLNPLSLLAGYMEKEVYKLKIAELVPFSELSLDDYYLDGSYKKRFNWSDFDKKNLENAKTKSDQKNQFKNEPDQNIEDKKTLIDQQIMKAEHILGILSGRNLMGAEIMSKNNFDKLLIYMRHTIEYEKIPESISAIPQLGISTGFLRFTFYQIHKELYTTKSIRLYFIDFLHAVFRQFEGENKKTTKTKFSEKPSSYDSDIERMRG